MKKFRSFLKLPGGGETKRCYYPFKLDTYGCGCGNNCHYCYARSVLHFRGLWNSDNPSVADPVEIEKVFVSHFDRGKRGKFSELLDAKIPLRLGGMTDCFSKPEQTHRRTLHLLEILKRYKYPYLILTKNTLISTPPYLSILDPDLGYIQFSLTTPFDEMSIQMEPGAEPTSARLEACKILAKEGFYQAARINPLFPIYPDGYFTKTTNNLLDGAMSVPPFKYFDWSLIDMIGETGINTVIAGFLRLSSWNIRWIKEQMGIDLTYLFDPTTKQTNTALHFNIPEKRYYYERIRKMCHFYNMEFSVCYDEDESYETFRDLWANREDCCNGKGKIPGFTCAYDFLSSDFIGKDGRIN